MTSKLKRASAVVLIMSSCVALFAKEQRLTFDEDASVYELIFDDGRIPVWQMREAAWLSPYVTSPPGPFEMARSETKLPGGTVALDKVFLAPWLELCAAVPPATCESYDPLVPDAVFLRNAANNLKRGQDQLEQLRKETLPAVLEPVRAYLLQYLQRSLEKQRYRYDYLKSGDGAPMRNLLCGECACGVSDEDLLAQLKSRLDPKAKLALSIKWDQQVTGCERKSHPPAYPREAWESFLREFGITERRNPKSIN